MNESSLARHSDAGSSEARGHRLMDSKEALAYATEHLIKNVDQHRKDAARADAVHMKMDLDSAAKWSQIVQALVIIQPPYPLH